MPFIDLDASSSIALRAQAVAALLRNVQRDDPKLDLVGLRGQTPDAIGVLRLDSLLAVLDGVVEFAAAADTALADRLKRALTTMVNDDVSAPGSEQRARMVERCSAMLDAIEQLRGEA